MSSVNKRYQNSSLDRTVDPSLRKSFQIKQDTKQRDQSPELENSRVQEKYQIQQLLKNMNNSPYMIKDNQPNSRSPNREKSSPKEISIQQTQLPYLFNNNLSKQFEASQTKKQIILKRPFQTQPPTNDFLLIQEEMRQVKESQFEINRLRGIRNQLDLEMRDYGSSSNNRQMFSISVNDGSVRHNQSNVVTNQYEYNDMFKPLFFKFIIISIQKFENSSNTIQVDPSSARLHQLQLCTLIDKPVDDKKKYIFHEQTISFEENFLKIRSENQQKAEQVRKLLVQGNLYRSYENNQILESYREQIYTVKQDEKRALEKNASHAQIVRAQAQQKVYQDIHQLQNQNEMKQKEIQALMDEVESIKRRSKGIRGGSFDQVNSTNYQEKLSTKIEQKYQNILDPKSFIKTTNEL